MKHIKSVETFFEWPYRGSIISNEVVVTLARLDLVGRNRAFYQIIAVSLGPNDLNEPRMGRDSLDALKIVDGPRSLRVLASTLCSWLNDFSTVLHFLTISYY